MYIYLFYYNIYFHLYNEIYSFINHKIHFADDLFNVACSKVCRSNACNNINIYNQFIRNKC